MNRVPAVCRRIVSPAAALLVAGALFAAPAARADFPFPPTPHELHHELRGLVHDVLRTLDRIPVQIHRDVVGNLGVFLVGNAYYGQHRHYHSTYSFPVWIDGRVDYRPYTYCNDRLYGSYESRPQFWGGWGEPAHGRWCNHHRAYYPTAHACFRPQYRQSYDSGDYRSRHRPEYGSGYGSGYRPQNHSNYGPGYRSSQRSHSGSPQGTYYGSRSGSHSGSQYGSHNRPDNRHRQDRNGRQDDRHRDGRRYRDGGHDRD
ncbi:MAG: hypothetical protein ABI689_11610 [Thermoanaerobaculia bacterium]